MEEIEVEEVKIIFERRPLSGVQQEALSFLNEPEGRQTKAALFQLLDNYVKDLADSHFAEGELTVKDFLITLTKLKHAVEKAKPLQQGNKNKK